MIWKSNSSVRGRTSNVIVLAIIGAASVSGVGKAHAQSASMSGSTLVVNGSNNGEHIYVYETQQSAWFDGSTGTFHPGGTQIAVWIVRQLRTSTFTSFPKSRVNSIMLFARNGNDFVSVDTDVNAAIDGGAGVDTIHGGDGDDLILAGSNATYDRLFGHGGRDTLITGRAGLSHTEMYGGPGADTYIYDWNDWISDDCVRGAGWAVQPDFTHRSGPNRGLHQISEPSLGCAQLP